MLSKRVKNRENRRKYYRSHKESQREYQRASYRKGLEDNRAKGRLRRKKWRSANRQRALEIGRDGNRRYCERNRLRLREKARLRYLNNRAGISEFIKKDYREHPEKYKFYNRFQQLAKKEITARVLHRVVSRNVKIFGQLSCYLCRLPIGDIRWHIEHKIPLSRLGGNNSEENLDIAHWYCNLEKGTMTYDEWVKFKEQWGWGVQEQYSVSVIREFHVL